MIHTTMNPDLQSRAQALIDALIDGDFDAAKHLQGWLMGECAAGLLNQDGETLADLRAAVADLVAVADRYGPGKPGDRWRAVWELLHAIGATTRPLEQLRLAHPQRVSGQLLQLIRDRPGISPSEMVQCLGKKANHVSNALRGLIDQGLVDRVTRGREVDYYLTGTGREALADEAPAPGAVTATAQPQRIPSLPRTAANAGSYPYLDERSLQRWPTPGQRPTFSIPLSGGTGR
jgi:DNA-binding MarR family transcriptional regulator